MIRMTVQSFGYMVVKNEGVDERMNYNFTNEELAYLDKEAWDLCATLFNSNDKYHRIKITLKEVYIKGKRKTPLRKG